jgi:hypothetical protein
MTMKFPAIALEGHEFNLRTAKIHANSNGLLFFLPARHRQASPGEEVVYTVVFRYKWLGL